MEIRKIKIFCENNNTFYTYSLGTSLLNIIENENITLKNRILGAFVNNQLKELSYEVFKPRNVKFVDITHPAGSRIYLRSLSFILYKAVSDLFPESSLQIQHSVSGGLFCELSGNFKPENYPEAIEQIKTKMLQIIATDIPIIRQEMVTSEAVEIYKNNNLNEKAELLKTRGKLYTSVYYLENTVDYFYGCLAPSTSYINYFDLIQYENGMLLIFPNPKNPEALKPVIKQPKMFEIFQEFTNWADILKVGDISGLNKMVAENKIGEIIKIAEALHEKKVAEIADIIHHNKNLTKIVLISGPSSSGKTTFSKRLAIQLRVLGFDPMAISLDNYFVNRENTPLDENGEYDFESFDAIDSKLLGENINDLLAGNEIVLPKFSFTNGSRSFGNDKIQLHDDQIIILEGIHALNPRLSEIIDKKRMFRIYVSALTQLGIDSHNRIPTTDNRLIRRIVRDFKYRGYSALETLKRWNSVRAGEDKNIFPFQEEADIMFNSALLFELGVLKKYAEPVLNQLPENEPEFGEAKRLLKLLSYFAPISDREIPPTSILREFLGGSTFYYS